MLTVVAGGVTSWRNCAQVRVSLQTPEFLGNPQRKGLGHRTSLLQGPGPAGDLPNQRETKGGGCLGAPK